MAAPDTYPLHEATPAFIIRRRLTIAVYFIMTANWICSCGGTANHEQAPTVIAAGSGAPSAGADPVPVTKAGSEQIRYGEELIAHTAAYLGPAGTVAHAGNGMNCQNCHLNGGRQPFANPFFAVAATYPKFRARSGKIESIAFRVNECLERSLNGKSIPDTGKEMQAMVAYLRWLGSDARKPVSNAAPGTEELTYLERPADPVKGKSIYAVSCASCHGVKGLGLMVPGTAGYVYPPLWGPRSFNVSAGMYRISKLAGFIKNNMPLGATYLNPKLSAEQAWDVAAFICAQPRTKKLFPADWPDRAKKPVDYPFGPYTDAYPEQQHKYGPFRAMAGPTANSGSGKK